MSRYAIGDLLLDMEIPDAFQCEYTLTGSLFAEDAARGATIEVSCIVLSSRDPGNLNPGEQYVVTVAREQGIEAQRYAGPLVVCRERDATLPTWLAGLGGRVVIATLTLEKPGNLEAVVEAAMASIDLAHDPFVRTGDESAFSALRPSHALWFEQKREAIRVQTGWTREAPVPVELLDAVWEQACSAPSGEDSSRNARLLALAVAFGDHLVQAGFRWCFVQDEWGTSMAVVALPESAKVTVVPESFIGKRWESKEKKFFGPAVAQIVEHLEKMRREWAN